MGDWVSTLFDEVPYVALFVSLFLGYLVGKIRLGPVEIGGIAGTLIVAIIVGQVGVTISDDAKNIAFASFIFALGFAAGPQFFAHLDREGLRIGTLSVIEVVVVVGLVAMWAGVFGLDPGTASGLLAGSATESAVLGTATDAIGGLPVDADTVKEWQGNVATAYSLAYLFGLITIVMFASNFAEMLLRRDARKEAAELWEELGGSDGAQKRGRRVAVRFHEVEGAAGWTVAELESKFEDRVLVEQVVRDGSDVKTTRGARLERGDVVTLVGAKVRLVTAPSVVGPEVVVEHGLDPMVSVDTWVTSPNVDRVPMKDLYEALGPKAARGVFVESLQRGEDSLPILDSTEVRRGDVMRLAGRESDIDRVLPRIGRSIPRTAVTDFVFLGLGVTLGILIGRLSIDLGGVLLSLGTGGGCLLTGLAFGWYHTKRPLIGNYPPAAARFTKDFGLATFVAITGLSVGPQAADLIREYGVLLPVAAIFNVLIPATISLLVGARLLKIPLPVLLGAVAGQQCSTPAGTAVVDKVGNTIPMLGYTVTYAISNVLLPVTGPIVVALTYHLS